eukprot:10821021-Prorocentrum_lima.AAC.1
MTSSLVGSEMCIRDRGYLALAREQRLLLHDGQWKEGVQALVVDINQTPGFVKTLSLIHI